MVVFYLNVLRSLHHRNFFLLWIGLIASLTGYWIQTVAQSWLVLEVTDSPFLLSLVWATGTLPVLLFSLPAGVLSDRMDRRSLLIACRLVLAVLTLILAVIVSLGYVKVWHIIIIAFFSGCTWSLDMPARQAMVPELVEEKELTNAVALVTAVFNASRVVGPGLAGVLVAGIGSASCFYVAAIGHLGLVIALFLMRVRSDTSQGRQISAAKHLVEGLKHIRRDANVLTLMILATIFGVFGMAYMVLMPVFARDVLGGEATDYGFLMVATGVGAVASTLLLAFLGDFKAKGNILLGMALSFGLTQILFSFSRWNPLSLVIIALVGASMAFFFTLLNVLLLKLTPTAMHGRVMSVYMLTWGLGVVGNLITGAMAEAWGAPLTVALTGMLCMLTTLYIYWTRPTIRSL